MYKKFFSVSLIIIMMFICAGCNLKDDTNNKNISIVTTIFPIYDWTKEIVKDEDVDITMLLDSGVDLHNYQPTADDIIKIQTADVFIYVGGESDKWVEDVLSGSKNENMVVINLLESLGDKIKEEEFKEGMDSETEESEEEEEVEYDEHVWISLKNASTLVDIIKDELIKIDSEKEDTYTEHAKKYVEKLQNLDKEYEKVVESASNKTLLFADRFPFRYLVDDYGLDYYAAFKGCSAETEASFKTITYLANKVKELKLKYIFVIENSSTKIAKTIINTSKKDNVEILTLNSMQGITAKDIKEGTTYLSLMENNLEKLKVALK